MTVFHRKRYYTSIFMKIKVCIKPIQMLEYQSVCSAYESVFVLPLGVIYHFETALGLVKNKPQTSVPYGLRPQCLCY
jgi:hypothetical protein